MTSAIFQIFDTPLPRVGSFSIVSFDNFDQFSTHSPLPIQINFLFVANVDFQNFHFSKQFLSNVSKIKYLAFFIKYLAFFIKFCFVVSLAKMVTLTTNIVYKKSAQ